MFGGLPVSVPVKVHGDPPLVVMVTFEPEMVPLAVPPTIELVLDCPATMHVCEPLVLVPVNVLPVCTILVVPLGARAPREDCASDHQTHALTHDDSHDVSGPCAEREPHADLVRPLAGAASIDRAVADRRQNILIQICQRLAWESGSPGPRCTVRILLPIALDPRSIAVASG